MDQNPVEDNVVTRFILGFAVIFAMMIGGRVGGSLFSSFDVPYAGWAGVVLGGAIVFVAFTVLYKRYDDSHAAE